LCTIAANPRRARKGQACLAVSFWSTHCSADIGTTHTNVPGRPLLLVLLPVLGHYCSCCCRLSTLDADRELLTNCQHLQAVPSLLLQLLLLLLLLPVMPAALLTKGVAPMANTNKPYPVSRRPLLFGHTAGPPKKNAKTTTMYMTL
jgi:hypothetical protein